MTSSAERVELSFSDAVEDSLRHDAPRRIAGAQEQNIKRLLGHKPSSSATGVGFGAARLVGRRRRAASFRLCAPDIAIHRDRLESVERFPSDALRIGGPVFVGTYVAALRIGL